MAPRQSLGFALLVVVALALACSSSKDSSPTATPTSLVTPAPTTSSAATPTPAPQASATPPADTSATINATNAAHLRSTSQATLSNLQGLAWEPEENDTSKGPASGLSNGVLLFSNDTIYRLAAQGSMQAEQLYKAVGERILDVAPGGLFATTASTTTFNLRTLPTGPILKTITPPGQFTDVTLAKDGSQAAVSRADIIAADLYSLPDGGMVKELTGFQTAAPVYGIRFSQHGDSLIWLSRALVQIQDIASGKLGPQFRHEDFVMGLDLDSDGGALATGVGKVATIWNAQTGATIITYQLPGISNDLEFSPNDLLLAVATDQGASIWDLRSGQQVGTLPGNMRLVGFSPDGQSLATVTADGVVTVWRP